MLDIVHVLCYTVFIVKFKKEDEMYNTINSNQETKLMTASEFTMKDQSSEPFAWMIEGVDEVGDVEQYVRSYAKMYAQSQSDNYIANAKTIYRVWRSSDEFSQAVRAIKRMLAAREAGDIASQILSEDGFGVIVNGWWYRTDVEIEQQQVTLRSGQDAMPPSHSTTYSYDEIDQLMARMAEIAPLAEWQSFDEFYE